MTVYLSNRDGAGKTDEEGHYKFPVNMFTGSVADVNDLKVTERNPTSLGVSVATGLFKILDISGRFSYTGWSDSVANLIISTADPANSRISSIVLYVDKDASTSPAPPNNPGVVKFIVVDGNPSATPTAPTNAMIHSVINATNPYIVLANVLVAANATSITNSNITDTRTITTISANAIPEASITSSKLSLSRDTDANGWRVTDFGTFKEFEREVEGSPNVAVGADGVYAAPNVPLPVGYNNTNQFFVQYQFRANDRIFLLIWRSNTASNSAFVFQISNVYSPSAVNLTNYSIHMKLRTK